MRQELEQVKTESSQARAHATRIRRDYDSIFADLEVKNHALNLLRLEHATLESDIQGIRRTHLQQIQAAEKKLRDSENEKAFVQGSLRDLEIEKESLLHQLSMMKESQAASKKEIADHQERRAQLLSQNTELAHRRRALQVQAQNASSRIASLMSTRESEQLMFK